MQKKTKQQHTKCESNSPAPRPSAPQHSLLLSRVAPDSPATASALSAHEGARWTQTQKRHTPHVVGPIFSAATSHHDLRKLHHHTRLSLHHNVRTRSGVIARSPHRSGNDLSAVRHESDFRGRSLYSAPRQHRLRRGPPFRSRTVIRPVYGSRNIAPTTALDAANTFAASA